jgi:hypothetical protein
MNISYEKIFVNENVHQINGGTDQITEPNTKDIRNSSAVTALKSS